MINSHQLLFVCYKLPVAKLPDFSHQYPNVVFDVHSLDSNVRGSPHTIQHRAWDLLPLCVERTHPKATTIRICAFGLRYLTLLSHG